MKKTRLFVRGWRPVAISVAVIISLYVVNAIQTKRARPSREFHQEPQQVLQITLSPSHIRPTPTIGHHPSPAPLALLETTSWPTYRSAKLRASIKYPPTWQVTELKDGLYLKMAGTRLNLSLRLFDNMAGIPLETWVDQEIYSTNPERYHITKAQVRIGPFMAWNIVGIPDGLDGGLVYYFELGRRIVDVSGGPYWPSFEPTITESNQNNPYLNLRRTIDTMLSTLTDH